MKKDEDNIIVVKSMEFAVKIIEICRWMQSNKTEPVLINQLLRSGTSIGSNVREGIRGHTPADFYAKLSISLKEASESEYWLELLHECKSLDDDNYNQLLLRCKELIRILTSIIKHKEQKKTTHKIKQL
jgi:four helix bundle protein